MAVPFLSPAPGINYNFVAGAYFFCSLVLGILLVLDKVVGVEAVQGIWIVFTPFIPCLFWALILRNAWIQRPNYSKKAEGPARSKDD